MKKIIRINIILVFIVFLIIEITSLCLSLKQESYTLREFIENGGSLIKIPFTMRYNNLLASNIELDEKRFHKVEKTNLKPILLLGCSFAYSYGLSAEKSLHTLLSKVTNRTVYNGAIPCGCPTEAILITSSPEFYKSIKEPEYVIYLFIQNHFSRMHSRLYQIHERRIRPLYKIDDNGNTKQEFCPFKILFMSYFFRYIYTEKITLNYDVVDEDLLLKSMIAINRNIHKKYPKAKLIFLRYDEPTINAERRYIPSVNFIKRIQDKGIIYLDANEIVFGKSGKMMIGNEYMQQDGHPNEYAFNLLANKFGPLLNSRELDLKR